MNADFMHHEPFQVSGSEAGILPHPDLPAQGIHGHPGIHARGDNHLPTGPALLRNGLPQPSGSQHTGNVGFRARGLLHLVLGQDCSGLGQ